MEAGARFNAEGLETPPEVDVPGFHVKTTYGRDPHGNSFEFQEILD